MKYDYLENMVEDIKEYISENYESIEDIDRDKLYEDLWLEDNVTGNGSGSYYCSAYKAMESLRGNDDLVSETITEFCIDMNEHWNDYEYLDVSVRCYLLAEAIDNALNELESEYL